MSFITDLTTFLQKYQNLDTLQGVTEKDVRAAKGCLNLLNQIIHKKINKLPKPKAIKPKEIRLRELRGMEKKKFKEKMFVNNQVTIEEIPVIRRDCYVCKKIMQSDEAHLFYNSMCEDCGDFNYEMRTKKRDLTGYTAIVTGGRIKIGYEVALWLLRNNCYTIVTTRFPAEALLRFKKEEDYEIFKDRLFLYGLDFKDLKKVYEFVEFIQTNFKEINILINNAAQTLYQTDEYNKQLLQDEDKAMRAIQEDPDFIKSDLALVKSNFNTEEDKLALIQQQFPIYDINNIPVDFSTQNSWTKQIEEVDFREFAEAQVINSWVPFIFCSQFKKIMTVPNKKSFIINVTAMEGKFNYEAKKPQHPHTNMAKASLNMMTRTCGSDFIKSNIYMTCVDTGWCSEMNPYMKFTSMRTVPLDEIDGAMRILHPIFDDLDLYSVFLKDYKVNTW